MTQRSNNENWRGPALAAIHLFWLVVAFWIVVCLFMLPTHAGTGASALMTKPVPTPRKMVVVVASLPCGWETNDVVTFRDFIMVEPSPDNQMLTNRIIISPSAPAQFFRGHFTWPITNAVFVVMSWLPDGYTKLIEVLNPDGFVCQALITPNKTQKTFALSYAWKTNYFRCTNLDTNGNSLGSVTAQCVLPPLTLTATLTNLP